MSFSPSPSSVPAIWSHFITARLIPVCFVASFALSRLPLVSRLSEGTRTILLTAIIASAAAALFPHEKETDEGKEGAEP